MQAHTCALGVAVLLFLAATACADATEAKEKWSKPIQEAEDRAGWVPLSPNFRDFRDLDVAAQEEVATVLRPPEPTTLRQQRLVQSPRQGRGAAGQQPYFPGDPSHLVRFPDQPAPQLRVQNSQLPPPNFRNQGPVFLQPQPVPVGFPPPGLAHPPFQPQPIPVFNNPPPQSARPQNNGTFVNAGPQDEVQLLYVPIQALQAKPTSGVPSKQKTLNTKTKTPSFEEQLRQFVKESDSLKQPTPIELYEQDKQRVQLLREQEERRLLQQEEIKQRVEQEERLLKEQEERNRREQEARARKEQEERIRKENEQRLRKEQEIRERQEKEAKARKELEYKAKQEQEAKEREERERYEANLRFQQQQQEFNGRTQQFTPTLHTQEHAFQQHLKTQSQSPTTTPAPHQPPLAVYMGYSGRTPADIDDVLFALRDATTIPVIDREPDSQNPPPKVFVGPAEMPPPNGYSKFELPYLSAIESNRVERKVDQLPFFVAPLTFDPPTGYNKIPFPSPHVGSVVVSQGRRQQRPQIPDPQPIVDDYSSAELPSISPAIPLLVNSLQNGRGPKAQRPHVQQQFISQDQFLPNVPQFQQPHPQQHFIAPAQQHFIPQQQYEEEEPIAVTEEIATTTTTTTTTEAPSTRRPVHSRGRVRGNQVDANAAAQRTRSRPDSDHSGERRPANRGRRPVNRGRTTTTTPEPVTEAEVVDSSNEASQDPTYAPITASLAPQQSSVNTPQDPEPQFVQPQYQQNFEPSSFGFQRGHFPSHQQGQGLHALPVQSVAPEFEQPIHHSQQFPTNHAPITRGHAFVQEQFDVRAQQPTFDTRVENERFEVPKKVASGRTHEVPSRQHDGPARNNFDVPAHGRPNAQAIELGVSHESPAFHRARPAVFQPIVSTTPETFTRQSATPFTAVSSSAYPVDTQSITPHHVVKGEVGKVSHVQSSPFAPTPLPDEHRTDAVPTASVEPQVYQYNTEPVPTVQTAVEDEPQTASPIAFQSSTRTRPRLQDSSEEARVTTPRSRLRVSDSAENFQSNRFRGRGSASREENSEESTTTVPHTRTRTRLTTARGGRTTERPGLQITVGELPSRQTDDAQTEAPRSRGRFRGVDRTRGPAARQQLQARDRQAARQQENSGIDLPQPVKQQIAETPVVSESPVYIPDAQFESESQKSTSTEAVSETTTVKPGRRFNNFATGNRVAQRRPIARGSTSTTAQESVATSPAPIRSTNVVRSSRRQQAQSPNRVTSLRGQARIRRPQTTSTRDAADEPHVKLETGVTYIKNPYVTIHREAPAGEPVELQAAPPARIRQQRPQSDEETHAEPKRVTPHRPSIDEETFVEPARVRQHRPQTNEDAYVEPARARPQRPLPDEESYIEPARVRQQRPQNNEESYVEPTQYTTQPEYDQQYFSPSPSPAVGRNNGQFFVETSPSPVNQFSARSSTLQPGSKAQQYEQEEFDYQPRHRQRARTNPSRYVALDDPENPEYGEESQRSEQISIQQLEGALTASLFSKDIKSEDVFDENLESATDEAVTGSTDDPLPTTIEDEATTVAIEPETSSKPVLHAKVNEGKRRRIRVRTRKQRPGDVFETAESQNVATINVLESEKPNKKVIKNEWKLSLPDSPTIDISSEGDDKTNYDDEVSFTTPGFTQETEVSTEAPAVTTTSEVPLETSTPREAVSTQETEAPKEASTQSPDATISEVTTTEATGTVQVDDVTTQVPEILTTTTEPETPVTPRILGTSTTTEISLETEICYRGRCVKTKVDADQMPIEK